MKFKLTLKFNSKAKTSEFVEAKDRADLDRVLKETKPFWNRNRDRITVSQEIK